MQEDSWSHGLNQRALAAAREIARTLGDAGHRTWLVGGCVRDLVLGHEPKDLDLVSSATPDEVEALFPRTVAVGKAFGVMRVLIGGFTFEVATYRSEGDYSDGRHPNKVHLVTSAEIDATRRDFTCNALYLDPLDGTKLDPTGGLRDLEERRLVAVGDPLLRFEEDSLRLLRMARFEAALDLVPADGLHAAARAAGPGLRRVSAERVLDELQEIAGGPAPARAFEILTECSLLEHALPGLEEGGSSQKMIALGTLMEDSECDSTTMLACLLDPGMSGRIRLLDSLPLSRVLHKDLEQAWHARGQIEVLAGTQAQDSAALARALRGDSGRRGMSLALAFCSGDGNHLESLEALRKWGTTATLFVNPFLGGTELIELGLSPGPALGRMLRELEDLQLRGTIQTLEEAQSFVRSALD